MFYLDSSLSTPEIARKLLGYRLVHDAPEGLTSGWIVEVEAYTGMDDKGAHTYNGHRTPRVEAMYGEPGHFYIYQIRQHFSINFVTQSAGIGEGVLIRALEPDRGITVMEGRRRGQIGYNLTNGPGKLAQAMAIDKTYYGTPVDEGPLYVDFSEKREPKEILATPRIGLGKTAEEWREAPLRYIVAGNPYVSKHKGPIDASHGWL